MSTDLKKFEKLLRTGIEPTLTPEWGEELVKAIENDSFYYPETLKVFIEKAPLNVIEDFNLQKKNIKLSIEKIKQIINIIK